MLPPPSTPNAADTAEPRFDQATQPCADDQPTNSAWHRVQVAPDRIQLTRGDLELHLLAQRAIYWPDEACLFISDLHLGKATTFRRAGIPVPAGTTQACLSRIDELLAANPVKRLTVLGDLMHARSSARSQTETDFRHWRQGHADLEIQLILGNHDLGHQSYFQTLEIAVHPEDFATGPLRLYHDPAVAAATSPANQLSLAGHVHPAVRVKDGFDSARLPCFWWNHLALVLPAFGEFTGSHLVHRRALESLFACYGQEIMEIPAGY